MYVLKWSANASINIWATVIMFSLNINECLITSGLLNAWKDTLAQCQVSVFAVMETYNPCACLLRGENPFARKSSATKMIWSKQVTKPSSVHKCTRLLTSLLPPFTLLYVGAAGVSANADHSPADFLPRGEKQRVGVWQGRPAHAVHSVWDEAAHARGSCQGVWRPFLLHEILCLAFVCMWLPTIAFKFTRGREINKNKNMKPLFFANVETGPLFCRFIAGWRLSIIPRMWRPEIQVLQLFPLLLILRPKARQNPHNPPPRTNPKVPCNKLSLNHTICCGIRHVFVDVIPVRSVYFV